MRRNTITTAGDQYATRIRSIRIERDVMQLRPRAITNVTRRDATPIRFGLPLSSGKRDIMPLPPQATLNSTQRTSFMQQTRSDSTQLTSFERRTRRDTTQLTSFEWWTRRDANTTSSSGEHDATTTSSNPALVNDPPNRYRWQYPSAPYSYTYLRSRRCHHLWCSLARSRWDHPRQSKSNMETTTVASECNTSSRRPFERVWTNTQDTIITSIDCEMMQC